MSNLNIFKNVLKMESDSLLRSMDLVKSEEIDEMIKVFNFLKDTNGKLIFCGVGKSGIIAKKLVSTFCSLGLKSVFLHPVEALHGDLGIVENTDAIVLLSKSGTTEELLKMIPFLPIDKSRIIGLLGNIDSKISKLCHFSFDCSVEKEACINNQAPTTSSTLALAMGDAMAVLYENFAGLTKEGFAQNHPGGLLGKSLLYKVKDIMWNRDDCPRCCEETKLRDILLTMTSKPIGGCAVLDDNHKLLGIIVEGDIRRTFSKNEHGIDTLAKDIMTKKPISITGDDLAFDALKLMENRENEIDLLPVTEGEIFKGFIRLHDLLKEGLHSK